MYWSLCFRLRYDLYRRDGVWTCCVCYYTQEQRWAKTCEMCQSPNPFLGEGPEMELTPKWYAQLFGPTIVGVDLPRSSTDSLRKLKKVADSTRKRENARGNKTPGGSSGWLDDDGGGSSSGGGRRAMGEGGTWRKAGSSSWRDDDDADYDAVERRRGWNASNAGSPRRRRASSPRRNSGSGRLRRSSSSGSVRLRRSSSSDLGGSAQRAPPRSPAIRYSASSPSMGRRKRKPSTPKSRSVRFSFDDEGF